MAISVIEPISPAIERTKLVLFRPFDFTKWLKLGLCAFLATLGEGGGSGNAGNFNSGGGNGGGGNGGGGEGPDLDPVWTWLQDNLALVIGIAVAVLVVGFLVGLLITWLSSRGKFMFIDGIVRNRGAIAEPWREYSELGNSLFLFRIVFGLCCFAIFLLIVGGSVLIALPSIRAEEFGMPAVIALVVGITAMIVFAIVAGLVDLFLKHFVVSVMYLRRIRVLEAWGVFRHELLAGHTGVMILYVLFQIVIGLVIGTLAVVATCLTCCLTIIPYVGTVILLPLPVFMRSYMLYFIQQFGREWTFFDDRPSANESPFGGGL